MACSLAWSGQARLALVGFGWIGCGTTRQGLLRRDLVWSGEVSTGEEWPGSAR